MHRWIQYDTYIWHKSAFAFDPKIKAKILVANCVTTVQNFMVIIIKKYAEILSKQNVPKIYH